MYTQTEFVEDLRGIFARTQDARERAQSIADLMRSMFETGWPETSPAFGDDPGSYLIYSDEEFGHPSPGFQVLAYRSEPRPENTRPSPHDHGACFVVYGVARGSNVQTRYRWVYSDDTTQAPTLEAFQTHLQRPGQASYFLPGEIHSTQGSLHEQTVYVRITSMDLTEVERHRYDPERNVAQTFRSAMAPGR